jgi:hypothetical protein
LSSRIACDRDSKSIIDRFVKLLLASDVPFRRLHRSVAKQKLDLFEFASTSVAEARSSLWQERDFSSKDHCVDLLTFSASTHSFGAISAKGE